MQAEIIVDDYGRKMVRSDSKETAWVLINQLPKLPVKGFHWVYEGEDLQTFISFGQFFLVFYFRHQSREEPCFSFAGQVTQGRCNTVEEWIISICSSIFGIIWLNVKPKAI